jgi:membrane protease YdiL (CAAX protease family)
MTTTIYHRTLASASTPPPVHDPDPAALRPIVTFAAVALPIGWILLSLPVLLDAPQEPFALATLLLALLPAALVITARRSGRTGVRALLRDAVRLPRPLWWALPAVAAIPSVTWIVASFLGGAQTLTTSLIVGFLVQLVTGAVIINIWEETVWTGFVQRRAMARWGTLAGSLVTSLLFVGIHIPSSSTAPRQPAMSRGTW